MNYYAKAFHIAARLVDEGDDVLSNGMSGKLRSELARQRRRAAVFCSASAPGDMVSPDYTGNDTCMPHITVDLNIMEQPSTLSIVGFCRCHKRRMYTPHATQCNFNG